MALLRNLSAVLTVLAVCFFCNSYGWVDHQANVIQYLKNNITNYSPLLLPKVEPKAKIAVRMDTLLTHITAVDTAKQTIRVSALLQGKWEEERLVWNSSKFGNVTVINWKVDEIWSPLILMYNGVGQDQVLQSKTPVFLTSRSPNLTQVTALWRREFEFTCKFDVSQFPVDMHDCSISFCFIDPERNNSVVQPEVNKLFPYNPLVLYQNSSEWTLLNFSTSAEFKEYALVQGSRKALLPTYELRLQICRVSNYYFVNIIAPLILLSVLQVLVYFVPLESGEKLGFGITIMLSYTVFLLLLDGILPKSQKLPFVAYFITSAMILSTGSLLLTSLTMRLHLTPGDDGMPTCLRVVLVRFLGRLLCVKGSDATVRTENSDNSRTNVRKVDEDASRIQSDWTVATKSVERLMVALGVAATAALLGGLIIKPYWGSPHKC